MGKERGIIEKVCGISRAVRDLYSASGYHPAMGSIRLFSRARRPWLKDCCYHITHRCVANAKALKFSYGRDSFMRRLPQMSNRYQVKVLNFLVGIDGYRLLLATSKPTTLSAPIGFLNGTTAQDYASRKGWEGSVWKGKFNVTLIQSRAQALRCSLDMDFAMLREQPEDLFHPLLWKHSGHLELTEVRKRYRIIDRKRPCGVGSWMCLGLSSGNGISKPATPSGTAENMLKKNGGRKPWSSARRHSASAWPTPSRNHVERSAPTQP